MSLPFLLTRLLSIGCPIHRSLIAMGGNVHRRVADLHHCFIVAGLSSQEVRG